MKKYGCYCTLKESSKGGEVLARGYGKARQEAIYKKIAGKLQRGEFVHHNPYFAIEDNAMGGRWRIRPETK